MDEEYYNWIYSSGHTVSDARDEGYQAYQDGIMSTDNPYNNNDEWDFYLAWQEGWSNAAWDD